MVISLFESKLKNYNENTLEIWIKVLLDLDYDLKKLEGSFLQLIRSADDFPSVGKIIEIIEHGHLLNEEARQEMKLKQKRKEALLLLEKTK